MIIFLVMAASVALTSPAPPVDGNRETVQMTVDYGDLNLATAKGRRVLDSRIEAAATNICGSVNWLDLGAKAANDECRAGVRASAGPQVEVALARARQNAALAAAASLVGSK